MARPRRLTEEGGVATDTRPRVKRPSLFKVLLHNDDYTTQEFVVYVLETIFRRSEVEARTIMLQVHHNGMGVAGVYPHEVAEAKAEQVTELARQNDYPLLCSVEEE